MMLVKSRRICVKIGNGCHSGAWVSNGLRRSGKIGRSRHRARSQGQYGNRQRVRSHLVVMLQALSISVNSMGLVRLKQAVVRRVRSQDIGDYNTSVSCSAAFVEDLKIKIYQSTNNKKTSLDHDTNSVGGLTLRQDYLTPDEIVIGVMICYWCSVPVSIVPLPLALQGIGVTGVIFLLSDYLYIVLHIYLCKAFTGVCGRFYTGGGTSGTPLLLTRHTARGKVCWCVSV